MFVLIGLSVVLLKGLGMDIGWGYQLQSPLVVSLLIFLFIFLAGFFLLNVNFLNSLLNISSAGVSTPNYMNSFGTGFLAVIVATPCTAPFMGSALGFAILQPGFSSFLIFFLWELDLLCLIFFYQFFRVCCLYFQNLELGWKLLNSLWPFQ